MKRKHPILHSLFIAILCCHCFRSVGAQEMQDINPDLPESMEVDAEKVAANGLRVLSGKHVTIYTDAPSGKSIDELPMLFDAAVPQWCEYFGIDVATTKPWKMQAFVMRDKSRFTKADLIPEDLPEFPAGLNQGHEIWLFVQPDDYYTRHLLIHEGTHAFMQWFCKGLGAPWYAEGMAELLALHRWENERLSIHHKTAAASETEGWGRPKLIKQWVVANARAGVNAKETRSLADIFQFPNRAFRDVESYAWSWAACEFLGEHPLSKESFQTLQKQVQKDPDGFNRIVQFTLAKHRETLERDWAFFIQELEYGYDVARSATSELDSNGTNSYLLKTDRSWQYLGRPVNAGETFRITASGRFQIGSSMVNDVVKPWPCEANGITIQYHGGRPIGELQAVFLPADSSAAAETILSGARPVAVGASKVIQANEDGLLFLRINESPSNLADNVGVLKIAIEK